MMQFFKSSTKEAMNFLRYVGPGLLVIVMDGHIINDHAHYLTA